MVEVKNFDVLRDNKQFLAHSVKKKQEFYENLAEMSRNDDYTKGILLDHFYHQRYCKLVGTDLSREKIKVFLNKSIL